MIHTTEYSRKLDNAGRLVIPKYLRDSYGLVIGQEYKFVIDHDEQTGQILLGIEVTPPKNQELSDAIELVRKNGMKVTK